MQTIKFKYMATFFTGIIILTTHPWPRMKAKKMLFSWQTTFGLKRIPLGKSYENRIKFKKHGNKKSTCIGLHRTV